MQTIPLTINTGIICITIPVKLLLFVAGENLKVSNRLQNGEKQYAMTIWRTFLKNTKTEENGAEVFIID